MTRAIIPCAGFGTRMGMDPTKSKELLVDPNTNKPLIEYHLNICSQYSLTPLIITRSEKTDLIEYCIKNNIEYILVKNEYREWSYTVYLSNESWYEDNILLLPDTKFSPEVTVDRIRNDLKQGHEVSLGLHEVLDPSKWCVLSNGKLFEKNTVLSGQHNAFGIIGFKKSTGQKLFIDLELTKQYTLPENTALHYLYTFKDVTRTGKIE